MSMKEWRQSPRSMEAEPRTMEAEPQQEALRVFQASPLLAWSSAHMAMSREKSQKSSQGVEGCSALWTVRGLKVTRLKVRIT